MDIYIYKYFTIFGFSHLQTYKQIRPFVEQHLSSTEEDKIENKEEGISEIENNISSLNSPWNESPC